MASRDFAWLEGRLKTLSAVLAMALNQRGPQTKGSKAFCIRWIVVGVHLIRVLRAFIKTLKIVQRVLSLEPLEQATGQRHSGFPGEGAQLRPLLRRNCLHPASLASSWARPHGAKSLGRTHFS